MSDQYPPYGNQGQPPYGNQGQPPAYGQPIYPQPGYGPPQGPAGPGGPWGPGAPQGPGGPGGRKRGLLIGGAVLAVALVIGGITGAVALTGGDSDSASDDSSETAEPRLTARRVTPPPDTTPTEPTESADPAGGESFTAEYGFDVGEVCNGGAMTNAAAYDSSNPKIMAFHNKVTAVEDWNGDSSGYGQPWKVDYDDFEDVNVIACLKAGEEGKGIACRAENGKKKIDYSYIPVDYTMTFVEAQTGEVIGEGDALPSDEDDCPFIALIDGGKSYSTPDSDAVEAAVNAFEFP